MGSEPLAVRLRKGTREGRQILAAAGPLTSSTSKSFLEAVRSADARLLVVDLAAVPYVDSMGIGALVQAHASFRRAGRNLVLAGLNRRVAAVLRITGVEPTFQIFPTVAEAEAAQA